MPVNISGRKFKVTIGSTILDGSALELVGSDSSISGGSLVTFSGTLKLFWYPGCPISLDPRDHLNPSGVIQIGQPVIIDTIKSLGVYDRFPRGYLRIGSNLNYDYETKTLSASVVDNIAAFNFREPTNPYKVNVKLGQSEPIKDIVDRLAAIAGLGTPNWITEPIEEINHPLDMGQSYIQTLGELLKDVGFIGWIDGYGVLQIDTAENLKNPNPIIDISTGPDGEEVDIVPSPGLEPMPEYLRVSGNRKVVIANELTYIKDTFTYGPGTDIPGVTDPSTITLRQLNEVMITLDSPAYQKQTLFEYLPKGVVVDGYDVVAASSPGNTDSLLRYTNLTERILARQTVEEWYYQETQDGSIFRYEKRVLGVLVLAYPAYVAFHKKAKSAYWTGTLSYLLTDNNAGQLYQISKQVITYGYDNRGQPILTTTEDWMTQSEILRNVTFTWDNSIRQDLKVGSRVTEYLYQTGNGEWNRKTETQQANALRYPKRYEGKPLTLVLSQGLTLANATQVEPGVQAPTDTKRKPAQFSEGTYPITVDVPFPGYTASAYKPRYKSIQVKYVDAVEVTAPVYQGLQAQLKPTDPSGGSALEIEDRTSPTNEICTARAKAQLRRLGEIWGAYYAGMIYADEVTIPLRSELFDSYKPLAGVTATYGGKQRLYAMDNTSWLLASDKCQVTFKGIFAGVLASVPIPGSPPVIVLTPPYPQQVQARFAEVGTFEAVGVPYSLTGTSVDVEFLEVGTFEVTSGDGALSWLDLTYDQWIGLTYEEWLEMSYN